MKNKKIFKQTFLGMMIALELILMFTPLGYVPVGLLRITTMHIPVLISAMVIGPKGGLILGFIFGLSSIIYNTMNPTITSFVFSPFVNVGGFQGNGYSLMIAIIPRMLLGYLSGVTYQKIKNKTAAIISSAMIGTFVNTALVLSGIYIFFGTSYAIARGIEQQTLINVLLATVMSNGVLEIILAIVACLLIVKAVER